MPLSSKEKSVFIPRAFGTLTVAEPQSQMLTCLIRYSLCSPSTMLRMIRAGVLCFIVMGCGVALQNLE